MVNHIPSTYESASERLAGDMTFEQVARYPLRELDIVDQPGVLVLFGGPPGAGKSTYSGQVLDLLNAIHRPAITMDPDDYNITTPPQWLADFVETQQCQDLIERIKASSAVTDGRMDNQKIIRQRKIALHILLTTVGAMYTSQGTQVLYQRAWSSVEGMKNTLILWRERYPQIPVVAVYLTNKLEELQKRVGSRGYSQIKPENLGGYIRGVDKVIEYLKNETEIPLLVLDESTEDPVSAISTFLQQRVF